MSGKAYYFSYWITLSHIRSVGLTHLGFFETHLRNPIQVTKRQY